MDSLKSINPIQSGIKEGMSITKDHHIKVKRDEEDQISRQKQIQYEAAQFHFETMKIEIDRKIFMK